MSHFEANYKTIENATLDDLISGEYGPELADDALEVAQAFSAMTIGQLSCACHKDFRLSDRLRKSVSALSGPMEEWADDKSKQDREYARDEAAWERDREMDFDQTA